MGRVLEARLRVLAGQKELVRFRRLKGIEREDRISELMLADRKVSQVPPLALLLAATGLFVIVANKGARR